MRPSSFFAILGILLSFAGLLACASEPYSPLALSLWPDSYEDAGPLPVEAAAPVDAGSGTCRQAHAQSLPQRLITMSGLATHTNPSFSLQDLYSDIFDPACGGSCHGSVAIPPGDGLWRVASPFELRAKIDESVLHHAMSDAPTDWSQPNLTTDPNDPMPPTNSVGWIPYSERLLTDPVVIFARMFQAWLDDGTPDSFTPPAGILPAPTPGKFITSSGVGTDMTNIGNCVPDALRVAQSRSPSQTTALQQVDNAFAALFASPDNDGGAAQLGLPPTLSATGDFSAPDGTATFDSDILATNGVVAYQPTYPNWFDNAAFIRHVRVPVGQSIRFDKASQSFLIPDNTRFYETVLKRVADVDGSYRWRKMETRILVARNLADIATVGATLLGTYLWDDSETDGTLRTEPLNDGQPFTATTLFYNNDEQLAQDVLAQNPGNPELALVNAGAARHYAVPSVGQCGACHQGSPTGNFVLGFTPLQINRRLQNQGGVRTAPGADELTQLQRFIDYGLITGMNSPAEVVSLEQSEGTRAPRNAYELAAQAYMVGNCAHCHNPSGYATTSNPELQGVLNFMPGPEGGIFQFPFEKYSPRIPRGPTASIPVPYITPSLMDLSESSKASISLAFYAPWRSLIYRAVNTPFPYTDDNALFPHMPMNGAGFDCSAAQIMSDWMVSIPAVRKNPGLREYPSNLGASGVQDDTPQPYTEVSVGAPGYDDAAQGAQQRLAILHTGYNPLVGDLGVTFNEYSYCPDTSDILDPAVERDPTCHPVPTAATLIIDGTPTTGALPVPGHAQWTPIDTTVPAGAWNPVRSDWATELIEQQFAAPSLSCGEGVYAQAVTAQNEEELAVGLLQNMALSSFAGIADQPAAVGLWEDLPGCDLRSQPTVASLTTGGQSPADWLSMNPTVQKTPDAHVIQEWPGAYVYQQICGNCHGQNADGHGRLATNLALMTGGHGIPSNFMAGLFGPTSSAGTYLQLAFRPLDPGAWAPVGAQDRAARYLAWMGLGGTQLIIPTPIVQVVTTTSVFGVARSIPPSLISGNMLSVAKALCLSLLFGPADVPSATLGQNSGLLTEDFERVWYTPDKSGTYLKAAPSLVASNGDAEAWLKVCSIGNPPPVRAIYGAVDTRVQNTIAVDVDSNGHLFSADLFSPDPTIYGQYAVGNDRGTVDEGGITAANGAMPTNLQPWCYRPASSLASDQPQCPPTIDNHQSHPVREVAAESGGALTCAPYHCWGPDDADRWATQGAINAGYAVFLYLQALSQGAITSLPPYNRCDLLNSD
jgi:hypothetical protein